MNTRKARSVITIAVAGILVLLTSQSQAYNKGDCNYLFGAANVAKWEQFRILSSPADFGDDPHLLGNPQGTAIVCWCKDGRVAIKGRLFSDGGNDEASTQAKFRFFRTNGSYTNFPLSTGSNNGVQSKLFYFVTDAGSYKKIRIRLYDTTPPILHPTDGSTPGPTARWLITKWLHR